jgi:hypothetical protein
MNGMIGNQNRLDSAMTQFIYMLPLGAGGMYASAFSFFVVLPLCIQLPRLEC